MRERAVDKVVTRICGGLGNQMFSYAVGERLARQYGVCQEYDLIEYFSSKYIFKKGISTRRFQLDCFAGPRQYGKWPIWKSLMLFAVAAVDLVVHHCFFERVLNIFGFHLHRSSDLFKIDADDDPHGRCKIYSTWLMLSMDKMPPREVLRKDFALSNPMKPQNVRWMEKIRDGESVSIHVRRTDYLIQATPWDLPWEYYLHAIDEVCRHVQNPHWYVFSDDSKWCREKFAFLQNVDFVDGNDACPWEDLELMKTCRHHIIANSTFSWWGAFLAEDPDGLTVYPKQWGPYVSSDLPGSFIPCGWIGLDS